MELKKIIHQLRVLDCEKCYLCKKCHGSPDDVCLLYGEAADRLLTQQTRIAQLEAELKEEMYRHDRVQDFEVAEAQLLAKLREERRWIPVTERLPESEGCYIVYTARGSVCTAHFYPERRFHSGYKREPGWGGKFAITHWMLLPEPPKEVG